VLPLSINPNAAAQGALAVEVLKTRTDLLDVLKTIHDPETFHCAQKERDVLSSFGGGCHQKIGIAVLSRPYGRITILKGLTDAGQVLDKRELELTSAAPRFAADELWSADVTAEREALKTYQIPAGTKGLFVARSEAEEDRSLKQLIPYIVITCNGKILHYRRGSGTGEARLLKKRSLGIGGHINDEDGLGASFDAAAYQRALLRELDEELILPASFHPSSIKAIALINDDSNAVGAVHLGIVHQCILDSEEVSANEEAIAELGFLFPEELLKKNEELESWSQIVLKHFLPC
jgi:predicted NUDIX family phosphoesterase